MMIYYKNRVGVLANTPSRKWSKRTMALVWRTNVENRHERDDWFRFGCGTTYKPRPSNSIYDVLTLSRVGGVAGDPVRPPASKGLSEGNRQ